MPAVRSLNAYTGVALPGVMNYAGPERWELNVGGKYAILYRSEETIKIQRVDPKRGVRWWGSQAAWKIEGSNTQYPTMTEARLAAAEYIQLLDAESYDSLIPQSLDLHIDRSMSFSVDSGARQATVVFSNGKTCILREVNYTTYWSSSLVPGFLYASKNLAINDTVALVKYGCRVVNPASSGLRDTQVIR